MRVGPHSHPCQHCRTPVECVGTIKQNYDGFPEFICEEFHQDDGTIAVFLCEECYEADSKEMD
jgi:hypothetical protein